MYFIFYKNINLTREKYTNILKELWNAYVCVSSLFIFIPFHFTISQSTPVLFKKLRPLKHGKLTLWYQLHDLLISSVTKYISVIQGDSLARGPKLVYLQIFNEFVNQLTHDELTTGYYQQDGAICHTSNARMREI